MVTAVAINLFKQNFSNTAQICIWQCFIFLLFLSSLHSFEYLFPSLIFPEIIISGLSCFSFFFVSSSGPKSMKICWYHKASTVFIQERCNQKETLPNQYQINLSHIKWYHYWSFRSNLVNYFLWLTMPACYKSSLQMKLLQRL